MQVWKSDMPKSTQAIYNAKHMKSTGLHEKTHPDANDTIQLESLLAILAARNLLAILAARNKNQNVARKEWKKQCHSTCDV